VGIAVEARNLFKKYVTKKRLGLIRNVTEYVEALRGVSLNVRHGEVVGLLGPNGAGKTTTIKILSTLLLPDSGEAYVEGFDVVREADKVRERIGIMLTVEKGFYNRLTGRENLEYFGALYGIPPKILKDRIDKLLNLLELDKLGGSDRLFEEFSLGMKARLSLARALLKDPPVVFLDEPTLGLDPPSARKIRLLVKELAREGKAVLYTSHNMFEVEIVCDRIVMINKGRIVAEGSPEELKSRIPKVRALEVHLREAPNHIINTFKEMGLEVSQYSQSSEETYVLKILTKNPEEVVDDVVKVITSAGLDIVKFKLEEPTLEDVFIYFAGDSSG